MPIPDWLARTGFRGVSVGHLVTLINRFKKKKGGPATLNMDEFEVDKMAIELYYPTAPPLELPAILMKRVLGESRLSDETFFEDPAVQSVFDEGDLREIEKSGKRKASNSKTHDDNDDGYDMVLASVGGSCKIAFWGSSSST